MVWGWHHFVPLPAGAKYKAMKYPQEVAIEALLAEVWQRNTIGRSQVKKLLL